MEYVSVEELSRILEGDRTVVLQEVTAKKHRQWVFQGERLKAVREKMLDQADYAAATDVIFICDDKEQCEKEARQIKDGINAGYLAGGYLAWGQFYHPVLVGFDEKVKVWQIHRLAKGCLSYLVVSGDQCLVIDPCYHIDYYLGLAHREKTDIKCVIDTQIHTDHVSGGARLAAKTSSPYYVPSHEGLKSDSKPLEKESELRVNQANMQVIPFSSPGSSGERGVGLILNDQYLFVGDTPLEAVREQILGMVPPRSDRTLLILPAHLSTLGSLTRHGIVATALGPIKREGVNEGEEQAISVSQPQAKAGEIFQVNLTQERIDLDKANQLELGLEHTP